MEWAFSVQVSPPPETVIVVTEAPPLVATRATRRLPAGGVKLAVVSVVAVVVLATAGADPFSAVVPRTSSRETEPGVDGAEKPTETPVPEVVVPVDLQVPYRSPLVASAMLSIVVVFALAVYDVFAPLVAAP